MAYELLEKNAVRFEKVQLISIDEATANGAKDITSLTSMYMHRIKAV